MVKLDNDLRELIAAVREERKPHKTCLSVQDGVDMRALLGEIIDKDVYREDYETVTETLLFEPLPYRDAIGALKRIRDSGLF